MQYQNYPFSVIRAQPQLQVEANLILVFYGLLCIGLERGGGTSLRGKTGMCASFG